MSIVIDEIKDYIFSHGKESCFWKDRKTGKRFYCANEDYRTYKNKGDDGVLLLDNPLITMIYDGAQDVYLIELSNKELWTFDNKVFYNEKLEDELPRFINIINEGMICDFIMLDEKK